MRVNRTVKFIKEFMTYIYCTKVAEEILDSLLY